MKKTYNLYLKLYLDYIIDRQLKVISLNNSESNLKKTMIKSALVLSTNKIGIVKKAESVFNIKNESLQVLKKLSEESLNVKIVRQKIKV